MNSAMMFRMYWRKLPMTTPSYRSGSPRSSAMWRRSTIKRPRRQVFEPQFLHWYFFLLYGYRDCPPLYRQPTAERRLSLFNCTATDSIFVHTSHRQTIFVHTADLYILDLCHREILPIVWSKTQQYFTSCSWEDNYQFESERYWWYDAIIALIFSIFGLLSALGEYLAWPHSFLCTRIVEYVRIRHSVENISLQNSRESMSLSLTDSQELVKLSSMHWWQGHLQQIKFNIINHKCPIYCCVTLYKCVEYL